MFCSYLVDRSPRDLQVVAVTQSDEYGPVGQQVQHELVAYPSQKLAPGRPQEGRVGGVGATLLRVRHAASVPTPAVGTPLGDGAGKKPHHPLHLLYFTQSVLSKYHCRTFRYPFRRTDSELLWTSVSIARYRICAVWRTVQV